MINQENLNKLYEGILGGHELTTKELKTYGFNSKDLSDLIDNGILERIKRGYYSFLSVNDLFYYGKKLISLKEYDKATHCFEKCYELDPTHLGICFQLFLRKIQNKEYQQAFEYFEQFYDSDNKFYNSDSNLYLYLLNIITEIPEHYRQYVRFLKFEDIRVDFNDKRYKDVQAHNRVRTALMQQKFIYASKQLNDIVKQNEKFKVQDILLNTLIAQAIEKQNAVKNEILDLLKEKDYDSIIQYLDKIEHRHDLSAANSLILQLTKDLKDIIETGNIPEKQVYSTNKLFEAINGKNYELALSLSAEYTKNENISSDDNAVYILLNEINKVMYNEKKSCQLENHTIELETKPVIQENSTIIINENSVSFTSAFADVIKCLMNRDLDNSFTILKKYLNSINKSEYEFLIIDLIKISLLENDLAFSKPMIVLTYLARDKFEFDILEYIQKFYETITQNKFDQTRVYLDIISKSNLLTESNILIDGLEAVLTEVLNRVEQTNQYLPSQTLSNENDVNPGVTIKETSKVEVEKQPVQISHPVIKKEISNVNHDYDDNNFINQKRDELYEKGMILLEPMDQERRKRIHEIVKNIPDIVSFSIKTESSERVVLRYKPYIYEYVDVPKLIKEGNAAYKSGDYDLCIEKYKQLLRVGNPKAVVYAKIGLSYLKKSCKDTAINYLIVAAELAKKEGSGYDFTELIDSLNGKISYGEKKPRVEMTIEDFNNDIEEHYGIECVYEISELVLHGVSFEEACESINIDEEQKNIVSLIFARDCYANKNYTKGDQYLKKVEKAKNKTKFVNALLEEVRSKKIFYKNRINEDYKSLVLTSKKNN